MLAKTESRSGRVVLVPRKGERFLGNRGRERIRLRERRRRILTFLGEGIALTAIIGAVPPLRPMWLISGLLAALLLAYLGALLRIRMAGRRPASVAPVSASSNVVVLPEIRILEELDELAREPEPVRR